MAFGINLSNLAGHVIGGIGHQITNASQAVNNTLGTHFQLAPGGFGAQLQNIGGNLNPVKQSYASGASLPSFGSSVTPTSYTNADLVPQTSGGTPTGGGGGSFGSVNLTQPDFSNTGPSAQDSIGLLNQQYDQAANDISAQNPYLDQSYNQATGDINNAITSAQGKADSQKTNNEKTYGDVLKQAVQTYNDLKQREQGTFSALGALDSSAYQDASQKADQGVADQTNSINLAKTNSNGSIDSQLNDYVNNAHSQLGTLGIQYQQGKDAIASALAHNRLDQAQAIQSALQQIRSNAQAIANNIINFQNQAQLLKAQGLNVQTNIGNVSADPFAQQASQQLSQVAQNGQNTYQVPTQSGSQYLGAQTFGKKLIDPATGLPAA